MAKGSDCIRIGIVGLGGWTKRVHLPTLALIPEARVTALCARRPESLEEAAALCASPVQRFQDYEELVAWEGVDAVVVSTPNNLHESIAAASLAAGKHTFVEKPLAFTVEGCRRLCALARERGLVLQVGYELPYAPPFARGLQMIREGIIGEVSIVTCNIIRDFIRGSGWRADKALSGGMLLELTSHYINLADYLADSQPLEAVAYGGSRVVNEVDYGWLLVRYANGVVSSVCSCMFGSGSRDIAAGAIGTKGSLQMSVDERTIVLHHRGGREPEVTHIPEEMVDFVTSIRQGRTPLVNGEVGTRAVALSLAFERSALAGGERVSIEV